VKKVEASLKRLSDGYFWNGAAWVAGPTEVFTLALGTGTWTHGFLNPAANFALGESYTLHVRARDNVDNVEVGPTATFTYGGLVLDSLTMDPDFKKIDGFDVLFGKDAKNTTLELKNTNPGTFHYRLTFINELGVDINADNGNTVRAIVEVPALTNCGPGVTCPSAATALGNPAFELKEHRAFHVAPDDKTDEVKVSYSYKASGVCGDLTGYVANLDLIPDHAPKCLMVTGFAVPKKHRARLEVNFEFRPKKTTGWLASPDPKLYFRSGFLFKATTVVTFAGTPVRTQVGSQTLGIVGAGQRVTAIGGFVLDQFGNPIVAAPGALTVRLFNAPPTNPATTACTTAASVASDVVTDDGFYFIWKNGSIQGGGTNDLPSGVKYFVAACNGGTLLSSRTLKEKLGNKEFDEEDFYYY
jgi:hypothetical protein